MESIINDWKKETSKDEVSGSKASKDITPPSVYLLKSGNRMFAVVDDSSSIIFVASTTQNIYAVAQSKVEKVMNPDGYVFYNAPNIESLKVISCTIAKIKDKKQRFVIDKIVKYLRK
jgi:hypothetical protein